MLLKNFINGLLDYIWPQFCLGCRQEGSLCCDHCRQTIKLLPLDWQPWTTDKKFYFDRCYVCLDYANPLAQNLIKTYKYQYLQNLHWLLADILTRQLARLEIGQAIITNAPLHRRRKRLRGFDQTELLAKVVAQNLNLPYQALLVRHKNTAAQAHLTKKEREINVRDSFKINAENNQQLRGQTIILIDDVTTTGSTLNEAAKVLRPLQPAKIIAVVLAKN